MLSDSKSSGISTHTPEKIGVERRKPTDEKPSPALLVLGAMKLDTVPYSSSGKRHS